MGFAQGPASPQNALTALAYTSATAAAFVMVLLVVLIWGVAGATLELEGSYVVGRALPAGDGGIAHLSSEGRYLRLNKRFCEITGYTREELLSKTFREITHPEDAKKDEEHRQKMLAGALPGYSVEKRYLRGDGSYVWVSLSVSFMRRATDKTDYFVLVAKDVDARKKAELAVGSLTTREKEVLLLLARGRSNPRISEDLKIVFALSSTTSRTSSRSSALRTAPGPPPAPSNSASSPTPRTIRDSGAPRPPPRAFCEKGRPSRESHQRSARTRKLRADCWRTVADWWSSSS